MSFSLANQFLIAMPGLNDPNFDRTVTLICEHNEDGALGFIINQPTDIPLSELLDQQGIAYDQKDLSSDTPLYSGGPVENERGFILHSGEREWEATMRVADDYCITASRDIIEDIMANKGPKHYMFILGYAGWGGGQLEQEIADNAWLTTTASPNITFDMPTPKRWDAAAKQLGVDLSLLNATAGHA